MQAELELERKWAARVRLGPNQSSTWRGTHIRLVSRSQLPHPHRQARGTAAAAAYATRHRHRAPADDDKEHKARARRKRPTHTAYKYGRKYRTATERQQKSIGLGATGAKAKSGEGRLCISAGRACPHATRGAYSDSEVAGRALIATHAERSNVTYAYTARAASAGTNESSGQLSVANTQTRR